MFTALFKSVVLTWSVSVVPPWPPGKVVEAADAAAAAWAARVWAAALGLVLTVVDFLHRPFPRPLVALLLEPAVGSIKGFAVEGMSPKGTEPALFHKR